MKRFLCLLVAIGLVGCASKPPIPDWEKRSTQAVDAATQAALQGRDKLAAQQWGVARAQTQRTAQAHHMARVALIHCAVQQAATLEFLCPEFEALADSALAIDQAYARYLRGQVRASDVALLPLAHRAVARAQTQAIHSGALLKALQAIADPLSRLVAASVLMQQMPSLEVVTLAVNTASDQGWQRALLTWLTLQYRWAQTSGDLALATQAQQRLLWLTEGVITPQQPK